MPLLGLKLKAYLKTVTLKKLQSPWIFFIFVSEIN